MTVAVAPHQVYGPRDTLFLPNFLETAASGKLRIFGDGKNRVCFTHVDNYCHGLILAESALYKGSPALGQFYVCTDGCTHPYPEGYCLFWDEIDKAVVSLGLPSISAKLKLPRTFMMCIAYICHCVGLMMGVKVKLTPFTVKLLTMHRWFKQERASKDLGYKPIISYNDGWVDTIEWFRAEWLPKQDISNASGYGKINTVSQTKIDLQSKMKRSD